MMQGRKLETLFWDSFSCQPLTAVFAAVGCLLPWRLLPLGVCWVRPLVPPMTKCDLDLTNKASYIDPLQSLVCGLWGVFYTDFLLRYSVTLLQRIEVNVLTVVIRSVWISVWTLQVCYHHRISGAVSGDGSVIIYQTLASHPSGYHQVNSLWVIPIEVMSLWGTLV